MCRRREMRLPIRVSLLRPWVQAIRVGVPTRSGCRRGGGVQGGSAVIGPKYSKCMDRKNDYSSCHSKEECKSNWCEHIQAHWSICIPKAGLKLNHKCWNHQDYQCQGHTVCKDHYCKNKGSKGHRCSRNQECWGGKCHHDWYWQPKWCV